VNWLDVIKKHNIHEEFVNAKEMDKENRIFMSENYVIKLYYPKKYKYYYNELEVYMGLGDKDYLSKLCYYGEEEEFKYIIISRLKGKSLFDTWKYLNIEQKRNVVIQITNILKDINGLRTYRINFKDVLDGLFFNVINELNYSEEFINYIRELYLSKIVLVGDNELSGLIHVDVHFYNFFIDEFDKVYAYDFENTILAPIDYQLVRWYKMWKYPHKFYYPKDTMSLTEIESYDILMPLLLANYPGISDIPNFEDRVKLYILIYLLQEAKRLKLSEDIAMKYISDNIKIKLKE